MAGHSKFKNIMHRKGKQDKARGKIFTRLIREIIVAARSGIPELDANPRLRAAVIAARQENMPKDKIENAIKRGSGATDSDNYEEIRYEGYGPHGVAVIVETMTDNRNRTAGDIRSIFTKNGGNMGETGSVGFMFDRLGVMTYPASIGSEDKVMEAAIEAGADNCESNDEEHSITCPMEAFNEVREGLTKALGEPASAKLQFVPNILSPLNEEQARAVMKLIDALDDNDDVQNVTVNMDVDDEIMERLSA